MPTVISEAIKNAAKGMIEGGATPSEVANKLMVREPSINRKLVSKWAKRGGWTFDTKGGAGLPATASKGGKAKEEPINDGAASGSQEPSIDLDDSNPVDVRLSESERTLLVILLARNLRDLRRWASAGYILDPKRSFKLTIAQRIARTERLISRFGGRLPKEPRNPYRAF